MSVYERECLCVPVLTARVQDSSTAATRLGGCLLCGLNDHVVTRANLSATNVTTSTSTCRLSAADLAVNFCENAVEGRLHASRVERRGLDEGKVMLLCKVHGFVSLHSPQVSQVALVAHQHDDNLAISVVAQLLPPKGRETPSQGAAKHTVSTPTTSVATCTGVTHLEPPLHTVECGVFGNVVHQQGADSSTVVCVCDCTVAFLASWEEQGEAGRGAGS